MQNLYVCATLKEIGGYNEFETHGDDYEKEQSNKRDSQRASRIYEIVVLLFKCSGRVITRSTVECSLIGDFVGF